MLEIIHGTKRNLIAANELTARLRDADLDGTLYLGYPIVGSIDEPLSLDALLLSLQHGVVVFDFLDPQPGPLFDQALSERQDDLFNALYQKLLTYKPLRAGPGKLAVDLKVLTISPTAQPVHGALSFETLLDAVGELAAITPDNLKKVNAVVQRTSAMKPSRRRGGIKRADSRGALMARIEAEIANLDRWQNQAAIESPEGPQRIRGLAGSGKTIVLALKAAYWHAQHPEWRIAVTFHTRSLYQQFRELIRKFYFEQLKSEPDWTQLRILHSWGSRREPGFYSEMAVFGGAEPRHLGHAKETYGYEDAFAGVCRELLEWTKQRGVEPIYDAILVDEAQDLPQPFFELAYLLAREPKRIVWAYDELQSFTAQSMPTPSLLFGSKPDGLPCVPGLQGEGDGPRRDIILPVCYRNTPWALSIAHALGFGVYREGGLVQFFDDPELWSDIGYEVATGAIAPGQEVTLRRAATSFPGYFKELMTPGDAFETHVFDNQVQQAEWVAQAILENLKDDELEHPDLLVVLANPLTAKQDAVVVMKALDQLGMASHLAGVTSSVDELFSAESIAISGIFRAKGNEAPMVYVLNSEYGISRFAQIKRRNTLFTAITRSRGWVRLCGCGQDMVELREEVNKVIQNNYQLRFPVPTAEQLALMRKIHRDMGRDERERVRRGEEGLTELIEMLERGELAPDQISAELRDRAAKHLLNPDVGQ